MAISGYIFNADTKQVSAFNATVMKQAGLHFGLPLQPTSSQRAYMSIDELKQIRTALGDDAFEQLLKKTKVSQFSAVEEADARALIATRDPADIGDRPDIEQPPQPGPKDEMLDWHLIETETAAAWQILGGRENIQWGGVSIGHIDTGFTLNPALGFSKSQLNSDWVDTGHDRNFFERELNPDEGAVPTFSTFDSARDNLGGFSGGHGTRTMSLLSGFDKSAAAKARVGSGGGSYTGYFGTAPRVPVIPVRIEDTVFIAEALRESLPAAINYLVNEAGVSVISLSMGSPKFAIATISTPSTLREAIDNAYEKGVIFCCAAGNHIPNEVVVFPARCPRTIAIGGSAPGKLPWMGSSYGIQVDISAPAFPIRRASTVRSLHGEKYVYGVGDGTSFATPQVAAAAAMWLVHHGTAIEKQYPAKWQRIAAFLKVLRESATKGNDWNENVRGPGILNVRAALTSPLPAKNSLIHDDAEHE